MRRWVTSAFLAAGLAAGPALAAPDPGSLCDQAAEAAAQASGVPLDILLAISRAESGRRRQGNFGPWPWTINDNGQGLWFETEAEALAAAEERLARADENFDIGCFQINTRWHGQAFASLNDMFDPAKNARYAARFLTELMQETGSWEAAIAAYHSRTAELAGPYLDRVQELRGRPIEGPPPLHLAEGVAPPRVNLFPLLQSGGQGAPGSLVPLQAGLGPLFDDRG